MEAAKRRQGALRRHLTGKTEEDVVVVCALRTPITKARKGGLKDTPADDLVAAVLKGVLDKTGKTSLIEKKTYEEKKPMKKKKPKPPIHHRMDAPADTRETQRSFTCEKSSFLETVVQ